MKVKYVKIMGERNSGTNYLDALIRKNFDVSILPGSVPKSFNRILGYEWFRDLYFRQTECRNLGWKHAIAPEKNLIDESGLTDKVGFICVAKNPYAWLLSMHKRPYHGCDCINSFDEFLVSPWASVGRERYIEQFQNPIDLWNKKNGSYIRLCSYANAMIISYESILQDTQNVIKKVGRQLGIKQAQSKVVNINKGTKGDQKSFEYYKDYYLNRRWVLKLSNRNVKCINSVLSDSVMSQFGYEAIMENHYGLKCDDE